MWGCNRWTTLFRSNVMTKKPNLHEARGLVGSFVEEEGADAVVVIYSKVVRRKTETYVIPWGNAHTCCALIEYAYDRYNPPELEVDEEEIDEEKEEDDDD